MSIKIKNVVCLLMCITFGANMAVGRTTKSGSDLSSLKMALEMFEVDNGYYPSTEQGLEALIEMPEGASNWTRPYLDKIPFDPWNNAYQYRYPGTHNENGFDIYSSGPDGTSKTGGDDPDDINNWKVDDESSSHTISLRFLGDRSVRVWLLVFSLIIFAWLMFRRRGDKLIED